MLSFCFLTPKRHVRARNRVVWRITRDIRFRGLGCEPLERPGKKKPSKHLWWEISRIRGKETPWEIVSKFCTLVNIQDQIRYAAFRDDRLRGLGVAMGRISRFPIDLRRRPCNTLALPCECMKQFNTLIQTTGRHKKCTAMCKVDNTYIKELRLQK